MKYGWVWFKKGALKGEPQKKVIELELEKSVMEIKAKEI